MRQDLRDLARRYQLHNRAENKSEKTIKWHQDSIERFCRFVEAGRGDAATLADLDIEPVELFIVQLQSKPAAIHNPFAPPRERRLSAYTINSYVRALRAFSHWLYLSGKARTWALERLKPPRVDRELKNVLTDEELRALFRSFNPECFLGARSLAILALFLDAGLRASELVGLRLKDCDLEVGFVKVKGKGRKERIVGISG